MSAGNLPILLELPEPSNTGARCFTPRRQTIGVVAAPSRSFPKTLRVEDYESSVRTRSRRSAESERSNTVKDGSSPIDGVCSRKRLRKAKRGPPSKEAMLIAQPSQLADTLHRG
jgi:hypothetical protein